MKTSWYSWGALVVLAGLASACSQPGRNYVKSEMVETLEISIRPDTSKMFTYRLRWPEALVPSPVQIANGSGSTRSAHSAGVAIGRDSYTRLVRNATYVVQQSGYCREGFMELDHSMSRYHLWLKGECKEGASAEDQQQFGTRELLTPADWRIPD